jgi:Domain of unknown function DUF29
MATRIKARPKNLYEDDFYVWTERQAELLRTRRFADLDLDNLIEEVEALGRAEKSKVSNNARVIMEHLLKLQYSPATEPRNKWRATVREHRRRLENDVTPHLRRSLLDDLGRQYAMARDDARSSMRDHGEDAAADALPETCPYALDQITGDWLPQ